MRAATNQPMQSLAVPIGAAVACFAAWFIGGALTRPNLEWYATLAKPGFTPPDAAFPIAWIILYSLMAVSVWILWRAPGDPADKRLALIWFGVQLVVGVLWSFVFFYMHNVALGLGVILVYLIDIVITIVLFDRISRPAALMLVPLALWVCFATGLNTAIWMLNS